MSETYLQTHVSDIIHISQLYTIHYFEFGNGFAFDGESHDFWEIVYVDSGKVQLQSGDEKLILRQGELYFHEPNEFHAIRSFESAPTVIVISFNCDSPLMARFSKQHFVLPPDIKYILKQILSESHVAFPEGEGNPQSRGLVRSPEALLGAEQLIKNYLELAMILLLRTMEQNKTSVDLAASTRPGSSHYLTEEMKGYIEDHIAEELSVNALCNHFGYSVSHLQNLFTAATGTTIGQYVTERRVALAKQLIREGRLNFAEISSQLAFDTPQDFSRVFKRVTKMTPTQYRNSLQLK